MMMTTKTTTSNIPYISYLFNCIWDLQKKNGKNYKCDKNINKFDYDFPTCQQGV